MKHILEMIYPASWWHDTWREGLPIGNGMTGGNLYGGAKREILQLNRHDFWYEGRSEKVPDVHESLARMREKMERGEYKEANWEIVNALKEQQYDSQLEKTIPLVRMIVEQKTMKGFNAFRRRIYLTKGVAEQEWTDDSVHMRRSAFVSRVHDIAVYRISADANKKKKSQLEYLLALDAYKNEGEQSTDTMKMMWESVNKQVVCETDTVAYLYFCAECSRRLYASKFGAVARVEIENGKLEKVDKGLCIRGATQILVTVGLYIEGDSNEKWKIIHDKLNSISMQYCDFDELLEESANLHKELYDRAELYLGDPDNAPEEQWKKSNEELLMEAYTDRQSVELIEKLWHYGRYLFICGCTPSSNPFALYGLWNGCYRPQWCHNMANENMQMIYWHSMCGNLIEYNQSIFKYMNERIPVFKENGKKLFGIDGIYMTAGTTPGVAVPTQIVPVIINWIGAAGWIAQHYYQYFTFTRDENFARDIMIPYFDGVACFYEGFVQFYRDEKGMEKVKLYPSVSPENTPKNFMDIEGATMMHPMPTTINSTIDLAIMKEFFEELLKCCEKHGVWKISQDRKTFWKRILKAIPDFTLNEQGAVREWQSIGFEDNYEHRHLSHIYPVFPGHAIYPEKNPVEIKAYKKAVELRRIDAQTGWSMAHMAAIHARFRSGKMAMLCLDNMAKSSLINNFFTLHNDWRGMNISMNLENATIQLDAIMGYVNAVQEMILYTAEEYIALLPALEERIYQGKIKNFRYADGMIEMKWDVTKQYFTGKIYALREHRLQIAMPDFCRQIVWEHSRGHMKEVREGVWETILHKSEMLAWSNKA